MKIRILLGAFILVLVAGCQTASPEPAPAPHKCGGNCIPINQDTQG